MLLVAHAAFVVCNDELRHTAQLASPAAATGSPVNVGTLIKLPQPKGEEATFPAALDGSPYAFYFAPSTSNSTQWTININGGGWCYDEMDCACRAKDALGTSTLASPTGGGNCKNPSEAGGLIQNCNSVDLLYLDGASFSGYRADPVPVPGSSAKLWMRGIKNLDATIDWLFANGGLGDATEVLLSGESAGELIFFFFTVLHFVRIPAANDVHLPPSI